MKNRPVRDIKHLIAACTHPPYCPLTLAGWRQLKKRIERVCFKVRAENGFASCYVPRQSSVCVCSSRSVCVAGATAHLAPTLDDQLT